MPIRPLNNLVVVAEKSNAVNFKTPKLLVGPFYSYADTFEGSTVKNGEL